MEFRDPNSSSYYHHQPPYQHHLSVHQPTPAPPYSSASSSFPYYPNPNTNPNPNPNTYPSLENSLHIPSSAFVSATAAASDAVRPPGADPYPHDPYDYSLLPYDGAGAHSINSQSYPYQTAGYYYQHPPPPQQQQYGVVGTGSPAADLETKRQKVIAGGAPPDSVRICTICNVVCNSDKVFAFHLAGEKHALKAFRITYNPLKSKTPAYVKALHSTNKTTHPTQKRAPKTAAIQASKGLVTLVHSTYCDVCKMDCQSQEVLSNHKLGRKHMKNLQKLLESITPKPANAPAKLVTTNTSANQNKAVNEQLQQNVGPAAIEDLEMKKQKVLSGGTTTDAVGMCTYCDVCKIDCQSQEVLSNHKLGRKHTKKLLKLQETITPKAANAPAKLITTSSSADPSKTVNEQLQQNVCPIAKEDLEMSGGAAADAVRVCTHCDVCKIDCQSQEDLSNHKLGRKHAKNLLKLQESITPNPANAPAKLITTSSSANQIKAVNDQLQQNAGPSAEEDMEMKKQKVLRAGAAADAVRACTYCNVFCNSELVYNYHIAGKKHAAMVKKQQQQQAAPAS